MFFESWNGLLRVLVVGCFAYIALVLLLRVSGKRTLSKLNAFDLVVTVALGSTLATVLLSRDVPLLEGILAFAVLIFAQYLVTTLSVLSERLHRTVTAQPRLLVFRGRILHEALRKERLTEMEVRAAVRGQGFATIEEVGAVVLEADASLHVLAFDDATRLSALRGVAGYDPDAA
jgi:uncharacterized membrane protein YcaP (DUF421 family)